MFSKSESRSTAAWRISLWTTLAFAFGAAVAFGVVYAVVAHVIQERSDAWLSGEAEVLADVSRNTARDALYGRVVEEVAELAEREVPDELNKRGEHVNTVFFLQVGPGEQPLWVGPSDKAPFVQAIHRASLALATPGTIDVAGWKHSFRVVYRPIRQGSGIYLGFSDAGARHMLHRLLRWFLSIWFAVTIFGFLVSFGGIY